MAANDLIISEADGSISFGNHTLKEKTKLEDFPHGGDLYKVKTYNTLTKLEKNGLFLYESEPGTTVKNFVDNEEGLSFKVVGDEDAQITIGLQENTEYQVFVADKEIGKMKTGLSGKLSLSVELAGSGEVKVSVIK
ncbi:MAG: endosialidase [Lachnospiraceae bacterium]|nr:endosialidase [Candidatus Merdinaster equi]